MVQSCRRKSNMVAIIKWVLLPKSECYATSPVGEVSAISRVSYQKGPICHA